MALDIDPRIIINFLGHDGLEIVGPGPYPYRGIHPQEMLDFCQSINKSFIVIEAVSSIEGPKGPVVVWPLLYCQNRLYKYFMKYSGVIILDRHAVAWSHEEKLCYDPNGKTYTLNIDAPIREFHALID